MENEGYKILDRNGLEQSIVCSNCNKPLSVAPIYCIERDQQIVEICGRCTYVVDAIGNKRKWRQNAYERFANFFTFPCANKKYSCEDILHWDNVADHEKNCSFQSVPCLLSHKVLFPNKSCQWSGNIKSLDEHLETAHKEYVLNPPQIDWEDLKVNNFYFTYVGTQLVTIVIKYGKDSKYYCLLMVSDTDIMSQCFRYQLELFDENKSNSIILRKTRLESVRHVLENINRADKMLEVDINKLKDMLNNAKSISGRFGIVKKNKKEVAQIMGVKNKEAESNKTENPSHKLQALDEVMLQELECPVCKEHMIPPIYICETGHSICSDCQQKVSSCPNCRCSFRGARNYTLENLTTRVYYPCHNREIGCPFVTTSDKIRNHEISCELSDNHCLLKCGWKGVQTNMYGHLTAMHQKSLLEANEIQICDITDKKEIYYILHVHNNFFRFSIRQGSNKVANKYNIQHVGMMQNDPKFRYQLQIIDQSPLGLNLSFTNVCQCLTENPNMAHLSGIGIPWDLLKPFIFEEKFYYYKIVISKF